MLTTDQKAGQLYKHFLNVSDTRDNRDFYEEAIQSSFCIRPEQLLMYGDEIPRGDSQEAINAIRNLEINILKIDVALSALEETEILMEIYKRETTIPKASKSHSDFKLKEKLSDTLGSMGVILYFLIKIFIVVLPFVMIGKGFIWTMIFSGITMFFPFASVVFWIWGLGCWGLWLVMLHQ